MKRTVVMSNKKPRVVFPFVEAGFGHIMAEKSIADAFEKKYGEYCEVIRSDFFAETGSEPMAKFEKRLCNEVRMYNKCNFYGYLNIACMNLFGARVASWFVMSKLYKGLYADSMAHMRELRPDCVVSTHWATNYYAERLENKPITAMYGPDAHLNAMFRYPCDLDMISIPEGYERAMKKFPRRFNEDNLKLVPTAIREEAFFVERNKTVLRQKLGLKDRFTVLLMEGGYGIGLTEKICELLTEKDLPINLIAICGKNPELKARLDNLKPKGKTDFYPFEFCENILEYISAADLYLGKSGSGLLEPAFFHVPIVVTHSANTIEKLIAEHYVTCGDAVRIFDAEKCVKFIEEALGGSEKFAGMQNSVDKLQKFGGEGIADEIFEKINKKFNVLPE